MRHLLLIAIAGLCSAGCAGTQPAGSAPLEASGETPPAPASGAAGAEPGPEPMADPAAGPAASETSAAPEAPASVDSEGPNEFKLRDSQTARDAHGVKPSQIKPSKTEAAMKFIVVDKDKGPVPGVVIKMTAPDGKTYYTEETDAEGYAEVLVSVGTKYDLTYLSLGRQDIEAKVPVSAEPNQNIKLTLRYKRERYPTGTAPTEAPRFVLKGVQFDTGKATLRPESYMRLQLVVEYMTHKKNSKVEISGHTDSVGNPRANKTLSQRRAQSVAAYLVSQGIDKSRVSSAGYGAERPIASNDTESGRQDNRRIEVMEVP